MFLHLTVLYKIRVIIVENNYSWYNLCHSSIHNLDFKSCSSDAPFSTSCVHRFWYLLCNEILLLLLLAELIAIIYIYDSYDNCTKCVFLWYKVQSNSWDTIGAQSEFDCFLPLWTMLLSPWYVLHWFFCILTVLKHYISRLFSKLSAC